MFFKRKGAQKTAETGQAGNLADWTMLEEEKLEHEEYVIVPAVKQLNNGRWVVRLAFETQRDDGPHRYDFPGPMREYEDQAKASAGGLQFAIKRIETIDRIASQKIELED